MVTGLWLLDAVKDVDLVESNSGMPEGHWRHWVLANQRSEEPLSRMTSNCWALRDNKRVSFNKRKDEYNAYGVPTLIDPT